MLGLFKKPLNIELLARGLSEGLATECPVLDVCRSTGVNDEKSNLEYLCLDYYFNLIAVEAKIKNKKYVYIIQKLLSEFVQDLVPTEFDIIQRCKVYASVNERSKRDIVFYKIGEAYAKFIGTPDSVPVATSIGLTVGNRAIAIAECLGKIQKSYKLVQLFRQEDIMPHYSKFPEIDRSDFTPNCSKKDRDDQMDISWGEGHFKDGRPFRKEFWCANQISYLTFCLPTIGIENATEEDLKKILVSEGVIEFDDEKFLAFGYSGNNVSATKKMDASNNQIWEITVIVGDEDGNYIKDHFPLKRYETNS